MTYLYAGLGIVMLVPIMAGLQLAVAMGELEAGNNTVLEQRWQRDLPSRQAENQYLDDEKQSLQALLASPLLASFDCRPGTFLGPEVVASGFALDPLVVMPQGCVVLSGRPFDSRQGLERRARLTLTLTAPGRATIREACLVSTSDQRCGLEQELTKP